MNGALKGIFAVMSMTVVLLTVWIATPSNIFLQPVSLTLDGTHQTIIRLTPFGDVIANWKGEITMLNDEGFECSGEGTSIIQEQPSNIVSMEVQSWARPCIEKGPPYVIRYEYSVLLFGLIPLRPVPLIAKILTKEPVP